MSDFVFLKLLFNSYRHNYFNVAMLLISLSIATTGLSSVLIINQSAKQSYDSGNQFVVPNVGYRIVAKDENTPITKKDFANLRREGLSTLIPVAQYRAHLFKNGEKVITNRILFSGIDTVSLFPILFHMQAQKDQANNSLAEIGILGGSALAHPKLVDLLDGSFESTNLNVPTGEPLSNLELIPFEDPSLGNDVILDIQDFFALFPESTITQLFLVNDNKRHYIEEELRNIIPQHLMLENLDTLSNNQELTGSFHLNLTAMALLMFVVCMFIVLNAANLLINKRMAWFKICRQLGISRQTIFKYQLLEILILGTIATVLGILASIQLVNLVAPTVQATLEGLSGQEIGFGKTSFLSLLIQVFIITAIGCLLAIMAPLINTNSRLSSTQHVQPTISIKNQIIIFSALTCVFFTVFVLLLLFANNLLLLLMSTALLIFSGCFAMLACYPLILRFFSKLIPKNFPLLQIASKQSVYLSGKTKLATCAFFIAVTSNIGMNLMVDSFRNATQIWLESRLASDFYLYYSGNTNLKDIEGFSNLVITPRLDKLVEIQQTQVQLFSYPTTQVFKDAMMFEKTIGLKKTWDMFENKEGILVNQQFANSLGYELNDQVLIPHPATNIPTEYKVLGIYYDYGNPFRQALLPLDIFLASDAQRSVYAIELNGGSIETITNYFEEQNIPIDQYQLYKTEELLSLSMETFDKTFLITDGLNIVTLLVASFSLACVIVIFMHDDRPHNMLIRSFGVSNIKTQILGLYQYILLCLVGLLFATPFGVLLSWILIFKINLQAFSWTYPLVINMENILVIYALSLAIVLSVVTIPFAKASKRPIIEDLRCIN